MGLIGMLNMPLSPFYHGFLCWPAFYDFISFWYFSKFMTQPIDHMADIIRCTKEKIDAAIP
jgi:hypothetical protein